MTDNQNQDLGALIDQAQQFAASGRFDDAVSVCKQILEFNPAHKVATVLLAQMAFQNNQPEEAGKLLQKAIEHDPSDAFLYTHNAQVMIRLGQAEDAINSYRHALSLKPDFTEAQIALGNLFIMVGRYSEAISEYQQALLLRDDQPQVFYNMAIAQAAAGDTNGALRGYQRAITLKPDYDAAYFNMANLKRSMGDVIGAAAAYCKAATLAPQQRLYWQQFAYCLRALEPSEIDEMIESAIEACLRVEGIEHRGLARHVAALTMRKHVPEELRECDSSSRRELLVAAVRSKSLQPLYEFEPLRMILTKEPINDWEFENFLTDLRYALLDATLSHETNIGPEKETGFFITALAHQCFINEYVYYKTAKEDELLEALQARIDTSLRTRNEISDGIIALLGCYRPLGSILRQKTLAAHTAEIKIPMLASLISLQTSEPELLNKLAADIPSLTTCESADEDSVQQQYEVNPYPRWFNLPFTIPRQSADIFGQLFPHLLRERVKFPTAPKLLIAGCGTGRDALIAASHFNGSKVIAIDVSRPSLAFAIRQSERLGITNVEFGQADILQLNDSFGLFDIVEAVGVLHHLADLKEGLMRLRDRLQIGGLMKLGLYSKLGRNAVRSGKELASKWGMGTSENDIRLFRKRVMELGNDAEARQLAHFVDFYTISGCRDLVFHAREHWYTLPEIKQLLSDLNLTFVGFELEEPTYLRQYRMQFPDDPDAKSLEKWHQFELQHPQLFASMYQFWVRQRS